MGLADAAAAYNKSRALVAPARPGAGSGVTLPDASAAPAETDPTKIREGRGYDNYQAQVTNPGHAVAGSPHFGANAGPYGVYLNQLDTRGQAATTPLNQNTRASIMDLQNRGPVANASLGTAQHDQAAARAAQTQQLTRLGDAGAANAATQQGLAAWGTNQAVGDSGYQAGLAAGAANSDAASAGYQGNALGMFQNAAMGRGPSAAQALFQQSNDRNIATQRALAAGARGGSAAAAMRGANQAGVQLGLQGQAQAAQLRAAEQQAGMAGLANTAAQARAGDVQRYGLGADILNQKRAADMGAVGAIGGLASQGRAQDIGQAGMQADYLGGIRSQDIQAGAGLGGVENQNLGINNQMALGSVGAGNDAERLRQMGIAGSNETNLGAGNLVSGNYLQGRQISLAHDQAQDAQFANTLGAITGGAGAAAQMAFGSPGAGGYFGGGGGGGGGMSAADIEAQGRRYFGEG